MLAGNIPGKHRDGAALHLHRGADRRERRGAGARRAAHRALLRGAGRRPIGWGRGRHDERARGPRSARRCPASRWTSTWSAGDGVAALFGPSGRGQDARRCSAWPGWCARTRAASWWTARCFFDSAAGIDVPPQRRRVGYVFQGYALFPHLTVADNVGFGLARPRRARSAGAARTRCSSASALEALARALPARALGRPAPAGGPGPRARHRSRAAPARRAAVRAGPPLRRALRDELRSVLPSWGTAAVLVTHDLTEAYRLGDRIVVYEEGRVIQAAAARRAPLAAGVAQRGAHHGLRNILRGRRRSRPRPIASSSAGGARCSRR